jgi:hypothetical protein
MSPKRQLRNLFNLVRRIAKARAPKVTRLLEVFALAQRAENSDGSNAGEYEHLDRLLSALGTQAGYVVDIAAGNGFSQSSTLGFFRREGWSGLAVEMDPDRFSKLAFIYAKFPNARLARNRVTPLNVKSLLDSYEVPKDFDLLNLDIDSYDLYVIEEMLKAKYRPKVISMEINEKIPPPIYFTVDYHDAHYWQVDHFFGCSIEAAASIVRPFGYILQSLVYNNAMFIRTDVANGRFEDMSVKDAYDNGYRNKSDRKTLFHYNADVDCLLDYTPKDGVRFIREYFEKYDGKYTLRA